MAALGDDDAAVGMGDVAGQLRALSSGVDAHHCRSGHGGPAQQHGVLRPVVQQRAHVERSRLPTVQQQVGPGDAAGGELSVGVPLVLEQHGQAVVVGPAQNQVSHGGQGFDWGVHDSMVDRRREKLES